MISKRKNDAGTKHTGAEGSERRPLSPKIELFAAFLARGLSVTTAAKRANISRRTAQRHVKDPNVQRRIVELRGEFLNRIEGLTASACLEAHRTLREVMRTAENPWVRLQAAQFILGKASELREYVEPPEAKQQQAAPTLIIDWDQLAKGPINCRVEDRLAEELRKCSVNDAEQSHGPPTA